MKRLGLLVAAAVLAGLPLLAKADDYDNYNYGDARRRLAHHQNEEYQRLLAHQRAEREACRSDRYNSRCRDLKRHQKHERDRLKAHHRRERDRLKDRFDARRDRRGRDGRYGYDGRNGRFGNDRRAGIDRRPGRF
jgi:hypothetical protein